MADGHAAIPRVVTGRLRHGAHVAVWVRLTDAIDSAALAAMDAVLSPDERAQAQRLRLDVDRRDYVAAHGLLREALSACSPTRPADWSFVRTEAGRPLVVEAQAGTPPLAFSLTHTRGLVACAVTRGRAVGVDAEGVRPVPGAQHIADTRLAPSEAAMLASLDPTHVDTRFLELWTLKEAYAKAVGLGLQLPLDARAFDFPGTTGLGFRGSDDDRRWCFWLTQVHARYRLALAVHAPSGDGPVTVSFDDGDACGARISVLRTSHGVPDAEGGVSTRADGSDAPRHRS